MSSGNDLQPSPRGAPALTADERLQCLIDAAEEYATVTLDPAGCVRDWNRGAERLLGWPEQEVVGKPATAILPAAVVDGHSAPDTYCVRKDASRFRARITTQSFHDANGGLRARAVVIRDITTDPYAVGGREGDRPWLSTTIDSAMDAIITVDSSQRIVCSTRQPRHCSIAPPTKSGATCWIGSFRTATATPTPGISRRSVQPA